MLFIMDANGKNQKALTTDAKSETDAAGFRADRRLPSSVADSSGA